MLGGRMKNWVGAAEGEQTSTVETKQKEIQKWNLSGVEEEGKDVRVEETTTVETKWEIYWWGPK
jgi:hypothetical protein